MIVVENHGFPYAYLVLNFRFGPAFDPLGKEGLTSLTNRMLLRGTRRRSREAFEEAIESLGTEVNTATQSSSVSISSAILSRNLERFTQLLGEMLTEPLFSPEEFEKVKREMRAEQEAMLNDDSCLARIWLRKSLFPGHLLGRNAAGTPASLDAITLDDLIAHHRTYYTKSNLLVTSSGDVTQAHLEQLLQDAFKNLPEGEPTAWNLAPIAPIDGRQLWVIDKPERTQSQILVGHPAVQGNDPDLLALNLAFTGFGGTFTARLMQEVRVKRGWSYGAYARLVPERFGGFCILSAAPERDHTADCIALLLEEYERFAREGLSDDEIEFARNYLINAFPFKIETAAQKAALQTYYALMGMPEDTLDRYTDRLKAITPSALRRICKERLTPDQLTIVTVCEAEPLKDAFSQLKHIRKINLRSYLDEK